MLLRVCSGSWYDMEYILKVKRVRKKSKHWTTEKGYRKWRDSL